MADLVGTGTGTIEVVGRLKAEAFTNMNGGKNPSSIQANGLDFQGKPLPYGTVAKSIKAENKAKLAKNYADAPDWQTRPVSSAALKPAFAQKAPNSRVSIPNVLDRTPGAKSPGRPSSVPAKRGVAKR